MKTTCTSWSWPLLPFESVVQIMSILGFRAIDVGAFAGLAHFEPSDLASRTDVASRLPAIARSHGVVFTDLFVTFGRDLVERCVNSPDKETRRENLATFEKIANLCGVVGIPGITLCPGVVHAALGRAASLQLAIDELGILVDAGRRAGLRVGFEPHIESITESPEDTLRVVRGVPGLSLTLDYSHFIAQGFTDAEVEPLLDYAGHIHVRQARQGVLQARVEEGKIDFSRMLSLLKAKAYPGWIAIEYEWSAWQGNNRVDVLSETMILKRQLEAFEAGASVAEV